MAADTAPIRPEERFDEELVASYLRSHLPDIPESAPISFAQFPGGKANLTYLASVADRELVLRRPPLGPVAPKSHDMAREYRVLSVLYQAYPLAPRAFHLCTDESVMGKPFFVMERRTGSVIRGEWPAALATDRETRRCTAESLVAALADLHAVDYTALGLADLGRPEGFAARQVAGWTERWKRARLDGIPDMDRLAERLAASVPEPRTATLLHNDFKLDNTMVGDDGRLVAVFDWDMSTLGDPLIDLGTTLAYWEGPAEITAVVAPDATVLGGVMSAEEVIATYTSRTGFDTALIDWYRALASFRIAVIVQQIYVRYARGQTSDERFAMLGSVVPPTAAAGLALLDRVRG